MKIAVIIVRSLLGLMFLFASVSYFFFMKYMHQPPPPPAVQTFMAGMTASVYLMPTLKGFELLIGLMLVSQRLTSLAVVMLFPIILNILLFHAFTSPAEVPMAVILLVADLFLAWYYRKDYAPMFTLKP